MYTKSKLLLRTFLYFKISDNYFSIEKSVLFIFWKRNGEYGYIKTQNHYEFKTKQLLISSSMRQTLTSRVRKGPQWIQNFFIKFSIRIWTFKQGKIQCNTYGVEKVWSLFEKDVGIELIQVLSTGKAT